MGLPDLFKYIEAQPNLLVPHELRNISIVINGNGLIHRLFYRHKYSFKFGVNYRDYEKVCMNFLRALQMCKVKAYIIFDGALTDEKLESVVAHNQRRIRAYSRIISSTKDYLLPGFAYTIFTKVAKTFRVPFCCCDFEADREVVLLANALNCPVVGDDGDFLIFDIKAGYIPWKTVEFDQLLKHNRRNFVAKPSVICKLFDQGSFCENLAIGKSLLPLMACLLGNDFISKTDITPFHSHLRKTYSGQAELETIAGNGKVVPQARRTESENVHVLDVTEWISKYQCIVTAFRDVMQILLENNQEDVGKKLESCVQMYLLDNHESKFKHYLEEMDICSNYEEAKPPGLDISKGLPDWFVVLFRMGELQTKFINVILQRRYFTHLFVEDNRKPSCNRSSLRIRQAIFGILLKNDDVQRECDTVGSKKEQHESRKARSGQSSQFDDEKPCKSQQKKLVVQYDRLDADETVTPTHVAPLEQLESYGLLPDLWCIPKLSTTNRRSLLFEVLGLDLARVTALPPDYQLPIAVTLHCMKNSDPQVSTEQLLAMLLCFVRGHMCDSFLSENASSVLAKAEETEFQSNPINCRPYNQTAEAAARSESDGRQPSFLGTNQEMKIDSKMSSPCATTDSLHGGSACAGKPHLNSDPSVKFGRISERHLSLVQACAQWQSCMQYATYLNSILQDPFPKLDICKLYHGTEISAIYYALTERDAPAKIDWIQEYFGMMPKSKNAAAIFDQMYEVVTLCCGEVEPQLPTLRRFSDLLPEDSLKADKCVAKEESDKLPGQSMDTAPRIRRRIKCYNCGEWDHKAPDCYRQKNTCTKCKRLGHSSKFCQKKC